jgi:phytoene desaturase
LQSPDFELPMSKKQTAVVIGSGFAGLSAATGLARHGFDVTIVEKNATPGGRARKFSESGFMFDMGPSWYWMPDVFESYFNRFGKSVSDYYDLVRLDPSYRVIYGPDDVLDVPASIAELGKQLEKIEPGSADALRNFLEEARYKYEVGINEFVYKPSVSLREFADFRILTSLFKLDMFRNMHKHVRKYFTHPKITALMEFPVLFLGETPRRTPALYSLMNYADIALGTWYPPGGMHRIVEGMVKLAEENGVKFRFNAPVHRIVTAGNKTTGVRLENGDIMNADVVVAGADYHHVEQKLLGQSERRYTEAYWNNRRMAPSCLLYYVGVSRRVNNLLHHNLFFDEPFDAHAVEIYDEPRWPSKPLFYVSAPSVTDPTVAPEGCENLFLLIPVAPGLDNDTEAVREKYFNLIMDRLERQAGHDIRSHIVYKRSYAHRDFVNDYNSFRGNAYGLANTLRQTAFMKPSVKSNKISNLYYTGQLTVPGPGVPPSLISGLVVSDLVAHEQKAKAHEKLV